MTEFIGQLNHDWNYYQQNLHEIHSQTVYLSVSQQKQNRMVASQLLTDKQNNKANTEILRKDLHTTLTTIELFFCKLHLVLTHTMQPIQRTHRSRGISDLGPEVKNILETGQPLEFPKKLLLTQTDKRPRN